MILALALSAAMLNPAVTPATIRTTVCVPHWTDSIRPPSSYTTRLKRKQMLALHLPGRARDYEEDHIVSLGAGGNPRNPANLRPQLWAEAHRKDVLERATEKAICNGTVPLRAAQARLAAWRP